jgi:putative transposase
MPSTYTSLHYHLIFSTKGREPLIQKTWLPDFHAYLGGVARGLDGRPEGIGGVADHAHLLVSLKPTACLSDFMRELKKASSVWVRANKCPGFHWQEGYAAFSVSASALQSVRGYIANQEEHHRARTFREELTEFLEKSGVAYDAKYLD